MSESLPIETPPVGGRAREALLRRLIDYIAMPASRAAPQDRSMGGDILLDMLFHATHDERKMCAERLAHMREAPRRVLRYLAQCSFDIAQHVLEHNEGFDGSDLFQMVDQVSLEHRVVIAGRKTIEPCLTDKLAETGELPVLKTMLVNEGASLSEQAVDILVKVSRKEPELCALLIKRQELCPAHAMAMFWWSDSATRRYILQRYAAERLEMINLCSDIFPMAAKEGWKDPVVRKSLQIIERRQRNRAAIDRSPYESLDDAIKTAAATGLTPELAQEIGFLAGVKPITIDQIFTDKGGEGLAVLCKATGLKRHAMPELWKALGRPFELEEGVPHPHFAYVMETYEILSVAKAQTTLRYWNWSLSATFSPELSEVSGVNENEANDETAFSASTRTARLVFGK